MYDRDRRAERWAHSWATFATEPSGIEVLKPLLKRLGILFLLFLFGTALGLLGIWQ